MRHIIRVQKKRKLDHDKDSVFYVRERLVDPKNIARFASRKKLKEDENSLTSNLPSGMSAAFSVLVYQIDG